MITLDEKVVGIWFLTTTPTQDFLATIREIKPEEEYELVYRFRYIKDEKPFDSDDEKHWYRGVTTGTKNFVVKGFREVLRQMKEVGGAVGEVYELLMNEEKDIAAFMREFEKAPFVYVRQASKEEAQKYQETTDSVKWEPVKNGS